MSGCSTRKPRRFGAGSVRREFQQRNIPSKPRSPTYYRLQRPSINAFDTETCLGRLLLLCDAHERQLEPKTPLDAISFLWLYGADLNFFFNLGFDFSVIIKPVLQIDEKGLEEFTEVKKIRVGEFAVSYVSKKGFTISHQRKRKMFFDISAFYESKEGKHDLDTLAREFLGLGKVSGIDRKRLGSEVGYYPLYRERIIQYCKRDAKITSQLASLFLDQIHSALRLWPRFMFSSASISKAWLEKHHSNLRLQFFKLPYEVADFIFKTYSGGIFDVNSVGKIPSTTQIDINSAYPYSISGLFSFNSARYCVIREIRKSDRIIELHETNYEMSKKGIDSISSNYDFLAGFYLISIKYDGKMPYRRSQEIIYPLSSFRLPFYATNFELGYFRALKVPFRVIKSVELYGRFKSEFPEFAELYMKRKSLQEKFKKTKQIKYQILAWAYKIILNATYGCFAENKTGLKPFTNFAYASLITAQTRVKLWEAAWKGDVIAFATDSVIFRGRPADLEDSGDLGKWKIEFEKEPITIFGNGLWVHGKEIRKRGFNRLSIEHLIRGSGSEIEITRSKPLTLLAGLRRHELEKVGVFFEEPRKLSLDSNREKKDFPTRLLTFETLRRREVKGSPFAVVFPPDCRTLSREEFSKLNRREWLLAEKS